MVTLAYGDHFVIYKKIELLCIPGISIVLWANYTSIKKIFVNIFIYFKKSLLRINL